MLRHAGGGVVGDFWEVPSISKMLKVNITPIVIYPPTNTQSVFNLYSDNMSVMKQRVTVQYYWNYLVATDSFSFKDLIISSVATPNGALTITAKPNNYFIGKSYTGSSQINDVQTLAGGAFSAPIICPGQDGTTGRYVINMKGDVNNPNRCTYVIEYSCISSVQRLLFIKRIIYTQI